jgi:anti-sigma factor RsiW
MQCRDVRELADSFLSEELLTETNHEILRHLETCPECREDMASRRELRDALRGAFHRSELLKPDSELGSRIRTQLLDHVRHSRTSWGFPSSLTTFPRGWWALAASLLLVAAAASGIWIRYGISTDELLARTAVGDHRNCALKFQLAEKPISLEEAAQRYDVAYRVLENLPAADVTAPGGSARVLERHSCVYDGRRFAHIVLRYQGAVVSLLVTARNGDSRIAIPRDTRSSLLARSIDSISVVSTSAPRHLIFLVSDLEQPRLAILANVLLPSIAQSLTGI